MIKHLGNVHFSLANLEVKGVDSVLCSRKVFTAIQLHPRYYTSVRDQYTLLKSYGVHHIDKLVVDGVLLSVTENIQESMITFWCSGKCKAIIEVET